MNIPQRYLPALTHWLGADYWQRGGRRPVFNTGDVGGLNKKRGLEFDVLVALYHRQGQAEGGIVAMRQETDVGMAIGEREGMPPRHG